MTTAASALWDPELDADRLRPDPQVDELLVGGVDLHVHPVPSPFPRRITVVEAAEDAASAGFRAIVVKSHHHSMQTDVLAAEPVGLRDTGVAVYGGVALNDSVGGLNPYAVELALRLGGKVVWFPTISSPAHIEFHRHHESGFPQSGITLRDNTEISILDENGALNAATRDILEIIAGEDAILNCGHLPADHIDVLVPGAIEAGVSRIVISHPDFVIGADPDRAAQWCRQGAYIEHCAAMLAGKRTPGTPYEKISGFYEAVGAGQTIISSDLGQKGNPLPITAYRRVVRSLLDGGITPAEITTMTGGNAGGLLGL